MRSVCVVACGVLVCAGSLLAADWPGYLGPNNDAVSSEIGLLTKWPAKGPKQLWTLEVGDGYGGAAIVDGKVFILDRDPQEADVFRVLDLATGKEIWKYRYEAKGRLSHHGSRSTPAVTKTHVYTIGGFGEVHAFDRKGQKVAWKYHLNPKREKFNKWGIAHSPVVHEGKLIVPLNGKSSPGLVALDAVTGKEVWKSEAFGGDNYATPVIRTVDGKKGVLFAANDKVVFVDPANGKTIWKYTDYNCKFTIPAPTVLSDGHHVFITGAYDSDSKMIEVKNGKITEKFSLPKTGAHIHPPVEHKGFLYVNFSQNANIRKNKETAGLGCLDPKTGKILWRTGAKDTMDRGGFLLADGRLVLLHGKDGTLILVDPDPSGYKEVSRFKLFKGGEEIWGVMALSNGMLVLRDRTKLKCLDLRAK